MEITYIFKNFLLKIWYKKIKKPITQFFLNCPPSIKNRCLPAPVDCNIITIRNLKELPH